MIHPSARDKNSKGSGMGSANLATKSVGRQCCPHKVILEPTKDFALLKGYETAASLPAINLFEFAKASDIVNSLGSFYWRIVG